jgi:hypothetical protein
MSELVKITKPITMMPHNPKDNNETICPVCGGIGWLNEDDKWIVKCEHCNNGIVPKCVYCGQPMKLEKYSWTCINPNCDCEKINAKIYEDQKIEEEKNRYNKAIHYTINNVPKESSEMFYSDEYSYNEGFFDDIDELIDCCKDNDAEIPNYIWCTKRILFQLDATDFIDNALEDSYEDAYEHVDKKELDKLQIACDEFVKAHHGFLDTYDIDYSKCVELNLKEKESE